MKFIHKFNGFVLIFFLTIVSLIVFYPLVYVVSSAFTPGTSIADMPVIPFSNGVTLDNFRHLMQHTNYPLWFRNTFIVAVFTSLGTMVVATLGAYVFSRFRFPLKKTFMLSMLVLQVFPSFIGMIAIFVILMRFGMLDTLGGLVLVYLAGNTPFNTWLMKSYLDTIPRSMDEAARIDGASHLRTFLTIILPMAKPILIFLLITSFTGPWMDYILPRMVLRSPSNHTLAMGLFSFVTDRRNDFTTFAAGSIIIAVPFVVFFVATQRMLITSLVAGAVKE